MTLSSPIPLRNGFRTALILAAGLLLSACGAQLQVSQAELDLAADAAAGAAPAAARRATSAAAPKAVTVENPILFVTQVPTEGDPFGSRVSSFANHFPDIGDVPRGGDLMIRYPDGTLRNLTREAGYGMDGLQGDRAIAVREPTVHWSGTKAVFSMVVGAPPRQHASINVKWQLYEVTGLARGQTARITKVAHQPTAYNNISPLYTSDDRILFTSDRPRNGLSHLYPQLDEYESTPTVTGIFSLDPATGALRILNHAPSGAFSPTIDSYGRVVFTRWDHLQRDQQNLSTFGPVNYASEASNASRASGATETFPESRTGMSSAYGEVNGFTYNLFTPWQMNQDGTDELSLNHIGRHELSFNYVPRSFRGDTSLVDTINTSLFANRTEIDIDSGLFHLREDPRNRGTFYAIHANEFAEGTSGRIVRVTAAPNLTADQMLITVASASGGRYRNPLPLASGKMVASYTPSSSFQRGIDLRLHQLGNDASGRLVAGDALTGNGISKSVSWWTPGTQQSYSGLLWELEAVEVVARTVPPAPTLAITTPESAVLSEEMVSEASLREWMKARDLALIVVRNQTSRDRADRQQPFNLRVPGGVRTTGSSGRVYDISHFQILQGNQVRAYTDFKAGRRVIAQPMAATGNPAYPAGPAGSVAIASDGSSAAFVPASRALTWQTTDAAGEAIVRERVWVTMQPGEIRTCTGCHGENVRNQAGTAASQARPEALRQLLRHWKQTEGGGTARRRNGSRPLLPGG
ncbi:hypothetical protein [Luteimonas kalidii]|uniref:Hydrazine synthase alpha subunit middle domain-containing protein n=1 Tax=Luteimonas kalidii TaxID=3042025 RepID=A0ABT6JWQ0_9GAMM|nr:hypothetical protein [Luteimonas kalidii]MDH5835113.1 hypothetical protein [Luteimonas kalidii]